jgi:acyl carrier protein
MSTFTNNKEQVRKFLVEKMGRVKKINQISDDDDLIGNGIIDSLGIMQLVAYIEGTFAVKVKDEDIVPDNFQSVNVISSYIERSR